jgi:probable phosphoglycerate mutase
MRHGEVAYFDREGRPVTPETVGLTEDGERQAQAAAEALRGIEFDRVITSGLVRTLETARIVAPDAELETWPDLAEMRGGRLEDIPDEELEREFTHVLRGMAPRDQRFLGGGESYGEFLDRVIPAVERLLAEQWNTVLAVLHGGVIRAILSYALTGERVFLGHVEMAAASISVVDVEGDDWIVRTVGYAPLDPLHEARETVMERYLEQYLPYRRRA